MLLHIKDKAEFDKKVLSGRIIVDFFAVWCGPCSMLSPVLEKLAEEHPEIDVVKVDVDESPAIAASFDVSSIPTLLYYEDGKLIRKTMGYMPEPRLKAFANIN